jgi:hypothetical protein
MNTNKLSKEAYKELIQKMNNFLMVDELPNDGAARYDINYTGEEVIVPCNIDIDDPVLFRRVADLFSAAAQKGFDLESAMQELSLPPRFIVHPNSRGKLWETLRATMQPSDIEIFQLEQMEENLVYVIARPKFVGVFAVVPKRDKCGMAVLCSNYVFEVEI